MEKEKQPRKIISNKQLAAGAAIVAAGVSVGVPLAEVALSNLNQPATPHITQAQEIDSNADVKIGNNTVSQRAIQDLYTKMDEIRNKNIVSTFSSKSAPTGEPIAIDNGSIVLTGFPTNVDSSDVTQASTVENGNATFKNTVKFASGANGVAKACIGTPGALLVGPDFGNWDAMKNSRGFINPFSVVTQFVARTKEVVQSLREGGFVSLNTGSGGVTISAGGARMEFLPKTGRKIKAYIRGLYGDQKQDTDRNVDLNITNYKPGNLEGKLYPAGDNNVAFVEQEQTMQEEVTDHSGGGNCGDGGCSETILICADANTGAYEIDKQVKGRFEDPHTGWQLVDTNIR